MRLEQDIAADDRAAKETILASHPKTILMMGTERAVGGRWDKKAGILAAITTTPHRSAAGFINYIGR